MKGHLHDVLKHLIDAVLDTLNLFQSLLHPFIYRNITRALMHFEKSKKNLKHYRRHVYIIRSPCDTINL